MHAVGDDIIGVCGIFTDELVDVVAVDVVENGTDEGGFETMTLKTSPIAVEKSFPVFDFAIAAKSRLRTTSMSVSTL